MKKGRLISLVAASCCLGTMIATAQTTQITGTVISMEDNMPVIGASIVVKGTTTGTVTDMDGKFTLEVPSDAHFIQISYVGMEPQELRIKQNMGTIRMASDSQNLDEVVVTAMGLTREKKSLAYAIQEVGSDELTKAGQISVTGALSGKVAGVQINQFGGSVGSSARISVRGNSSLQDDQQPLIVVDGVPITNEAQRTGDNAYNGVDYGSGLNDINPEDIESMTVLKGGSAALYGMRAGNGVILITTKSGKGSGVRVSYDGSVTFDRVANIPKLQNSYGQGNNGDEYHWQLNHPELSYQQYAEQYGFNWVDGSNGTNDFYDESWGPRLDAGLELVQFDSNGEKAPWVSNPDNVKNFFQTGVTQSHTISVSANSEKAQTRASLGYRGQTGTVPNTDQKRYSASLNTDIKLNEYISYDLSTSYTRTQSDNLVGQGYGGNNPINGIVSWFGRQVNMESLKNNWAQKDAGGNYTFYNWNTNYHMNPYFNVHENTNSYQRDRVFGKTSLYYQPFEFLKFEGRAGLDYYNSTAFERHYIDRSDYPEGGFLQTNMKATELNLDFLASFNKTFGDFNVTAILGANYRDYSWEENRLGAAALTVAGNYTIGNKKGDAVTYMDHQHSRSNSVYANASIGWRNQLYLDASARNDWSSTIHDAFFYPSASLSWIVTETLPWLKGSGAALSFLKLRGGWAEIGNATRPYRNRAYYYMDSDGSFNGVAQIYRTTIFPNENLRPESIQTWEVGAELGFLHDRLHIDFAYYKKKTTDQILDVTIPYSSGYRSMLINAGEIQNQGYELQVSGDILRSKEGLNWTSTFNFSKDNSKVVSLYPGLDVYDIGWTWGISTQAVVGEKWGSLVGTAFARVDADDVKEGTATADQIGAIKVNENGLASTESGKVFGNVTPDFLLNWRNDFSIKNFSFGFLLDMRVGGDIWSQTMNHSYTAGTSVVTAENGIREREILAGVDVMQGERFVMQDASGKWVTNTIKTDAYQWFKNDVSEYYTFDGSYLKLREAYISYTFPKSLMAKTKYISNATLSLIGNNLWLIWVHKSNTMRLDPETGGVASDSRGVGFEQSAVPSSRSFGIKLNLTF